MSVFHLPRLHFAGTATTKLPTGPRCGLVDFTDHSVRTDEGPFTPDRPAAEFHDYLQRRGPHFDASGRWTPDGPFSVAKGWNFGGNGHFWLDAQVVSVETEGGRPDHADPVVGRAVDVWGHYNEYLRTTVNRARVFDLDPASRWTMALMVGRFAFGREGRSHENGYLATGEVRGLQPPRWVGFTRFRQPPDHPLADQLGYSAVHQFAVARDEGLRWLPDHIGSPAAAALGAAADAADGLVVQFALDAMSAPTVPDMPNTWRVRGTIAPWHRTELRSYPAGRLLVARTGELRPLTVHLSGDRVDFNLVTAVPLTGGDPDPGPPVDFGDLELRTAEGSLVARLPSAAYRLGGGSGIVSVPAEPGWQDCEDRQLRLVGRHIEMVERQLVVQSDDAFQTLHHRDTTHGRDHVVEVPLRGYLRGRPASYETLHPRQYVNPRTSDHDALLTMPAAVQLDTHGRGVLSLRGDHAGSCRVLLATTPEETAAFDEQDDLGFWAGANALAVRVLPDDWYLEDVPDDEVDFALLYREVFAFYDQISPFMTDEVFSLADHCKVATYCELSWQMCDPRNRDRTYYMPPTRDLTQAKARLLLVYLRNQQAKVRPPVLAPSEEPLPALTPRSRGELWAALKHAAGIELAVMLQYLYAAFSMPTYGAACHLVRQGRWTPRQLEAACGQGGATTDDGIRGALLSVAREEMIHFLLVNNIITAMGEPFHVPVIDFGTFNAQVPVPLDFALEGLTIGSVSRFAAVEAPAGLSPPLAGDRGGHHWGSISELYAAIRAGVERVPDLFMVERGRGGGEHHLFLRESVNVAHPDYQLEVDDVASALVAVDLITEQGEGRAESAVDGAERSHFHTFCQIAETLTTERVKGTSGLLLPWQPAYPVLRNPTLAAADYAKDPVTEPAARSVLQLFNRCYLLMVQLMVQHFGESPDGSLRRSRLMNAAIDVMTGLMRPLAELLVTMNSGRPGRTAGPSFELEAMPAFVPRRDVARRSLALRFAHLAAAARACEQVPPQVPELMTLFAERFSREAQEL